MNKEKCIEYWLTSAAHDIDVSETLFQNKKYDWCLFIGHLVIEKVLKAFYVKDTGKTPPHIHNLVVLVEHSALPLSEEQKEFLMEVNRFNIDARYPDEKYSFYKICTEEFTTEYYTKIKEMYQWLLAQIKQ